MPSFLVFFRTLFDEGRVKPHPLAGSLPVQELLDFLCAEGWDTDDAPLYAWVTRRGGLKDGPYSLGKLRQFDTLEKAFGPLGNGKTIVELFIMKSDAPGDLNAFLGALIKKYHFDLLSDDARAPVVAECANKHCRSSGKHVCSKCLQTSYCSKVCEQIDQSLHKFVCPGVPKAPDNKTALSQPTPDVPDLEDEPIDTDPAHAEKRRLAHQPLWHLSGESAPALLSGLISGDFVEATDPYALDDDLDLGVSDDDETVAAAAFADGESFEVLEARLRNRGDLREAVPQ